MRKYSVERFKDIGIEATTASASETLDEAKLRSLVKAVADKSFAVGRSGDNIFKSRDQLLSEARKADEALIDYVLKLRAPSRAADGQQGANRMTERKAKEIGEREGMALAGYVLQSDDGRACIIHQGAVRWLSNEELWSIVHPADGQQGASRAALGVLDGLPTYDPERDMPGVMEFRDKYHDGDYYKVEDVRAALASAPLPAQGAAQVEVEAARDEVLEEAAKVCEAQATEYFPMTAKGLADAIRALKSDCAAQSRAQSDTTGDHNA